MATQVEAHIDSALRRFGCDAREILPIHDLQDDLGIDSIEIVELAALICCEYGRPDVRLDVAGVRTVGDLVNRAQALTAPGQVQ